MVNNERPCLRARAALVPWHRPAVISGLLLVSSCYSYGPPPSVAPEAGTHVSIRLSSDATRDLALLIGPGVVYVEGVVLGDDSAGLHLAIRHVEGRGGGSSSSWTGEPFTFAHNSYVSLEVRHLSVPGTVLLGGLGVAAVVAMTQAFGASGTANTPVGGNGNPTQ
jgi:hypothetical protein